MATAALALIACDGVRAGEPEGLNRDPQTILVGRPADAISLDPARITDNESVEVTEQIYETLLRYRPDGEVEPGLATSWSVSADGKVWTFELRRGVRFHDGTPFSAESVVFSWKRQSDPHHPAHADDATGKPFSYWSTTFDNITAIEAIDEHTLRVTIDRPYAPFEANLTMFPVAIVSPAAVAAWGSEYYAHPVGTGPFRFSSWEDGRIVLERNDDYWDATARPHIKRLVFKAVPDARQRLVALESGAIDIAYSISPEELQFVALHPQLRLYRSPANNVSYVAFNTTHRPFDDVRVRQAANYAVNTEPIVKLAYQGMAVVAQSPLPPTQWGHHEPSQHYDYDPVRARALLAEAQKDGKFDPAEVHDFYVPITPRPYLPDPELVARVLQANLAEVGIRTRMILKSFPEHLNAVHWGVHDLCLLGWVGDNGDPDNYLYVLFDQDNTALGMARNTAFFRDAPLHELLVAAQKAQDRDARMSIYRQVQERIAQEAPWVPLAHSEISIAARADVGGIVLGVTTHVAFKQVKRDAR